MKTKFFTLVTLVITSLLTAQIVHIPDTNFKNYLLAKSEINTNGDREIQVSEAKEFKGEINCSNKKISNLTGIEAFENITYLFCYSNQLSSLDISKNTKLTHIDCGNNKLNSLDVSSNTNLIDIHCAKNKLNVLDLKNNTKLKYIYCEHNNLTNLDLSKKINIQRIICNNNNLKSINLKNGNNTNISEFYAKENPELECIQVNNAKYSNEKWSNFKDEQALFNENCGFHSPDDVVHIPDTNFKKYLLENKDINLNKNEEITYTEAEAFTGKIYCYNKNISDFTGLEAFINITELYCDNNNLTSLDLSKNTKLTRLFCSSNKLTSLDLSKNTELTVLSCSSNKLTSLDLSKNTELTYLSCSHNKLTNLDLSKNTKLTVLSCSSNKLTSLNVKNGNNSIIETFHAENNFELSCIKVDDVEYSNKNWKNKDIEAKYKEICECETTNIGKPTGEAVQNFTLGQTIANLQVKVNGKDLVWYSDKELTDKLDKTEKLVHNTTYYVVNEKGYCKS